MQSLCFRRQEFSQKDEAVLCQLACRLGNGPWPLSFTRIDIILVVVFTSMYLTIWDPSDSLVSHLATSGCWCIKLWSYEWQKLCCIFSILYNLVLLQCERIAWAATCANKNLFQLTRIEWKQQQIITGRYLWKDKKVFFFGKSMCSHPTSLMSVHTCRCSLPVETTCLPPQAISCLFSFVLPCHKKRKQTLWDHKCGHNFLSSNLRQKLITRKMTNTWISCCIYKQHNNCFSVWAKR